MTKRISLLSACAIALLTSATNAQNRFEGYNVILDVPTTQRSAACALRYAPVANAITVTDLDGSTPLNIKPCSGTATTVQAAEAGSASIKADRATYQWCFTGEDKRYRISFSGDQFSGPITYDWIATPDARDLGTYNIRDFGAVGDGKTDDTIAIKSAMAYVASRNGGRVRFPDGDYVVTSPIALPSAVTIEGTNGLGSNSPTSDLPRKNPVRISLSGANKALFRIGECVEKVTIQDIELYAQSNDNTSGIEAVGAYTSSQDFYFERVLFNNFNRGINAYGLPQTNLSWQFDYVKLNACRFVFNRDTGIYTNVRNSDWKIEGTVFINPPKRPGQSADSMRFDRAAGIVIQDTFGGGLPNALGGTFIDTLDTGGINIISSGTENMTNSLVYNAVQNPKAGNYSEAIIAIHCAFGNPVVFNARRTFVSTGNSYAPNVFHADERLRVYSTGDRFCYDGYIQGCKGAQSNDFDRATVVFMTGQPAEGSVAGHPAIFGTDVQFNSPIRLPSLKQDALPAGKPDGSLVYCANCRRSTTPCQGGGNGAPAMMVAGVWSCL
ncbi:MAG TPA: glycosyl hydrolase family 28-related protein [Pyrinomonadaceae bacterium]